MQHASASRRRITITFLLMFLSLPLAASKVRRMSLDDLRTKADTVIVGEVVASSMRADAEKKMVWTDYQVRVDEVVAGPRRDGVMTVSFAGGQAEGLDIGVTDVPKLVTGSRYVLFLKTDDPLRAAPTVGWGQGIFEFKDVRFGNTLGEILVSYDGEPLEVRSGRKLVRGGTIQIENANIQPLEAEAVSTRRPMVVLTPDGKQVPQPRFRARTQELVMPTYATLSDVRDFVNGRINSAELPQRRIRQQ